MGETTPNELDDSETTDKPGARSLPDEQSSSASLFSAIALIVGLPLLLGLGLWFRLPGLDLLNQRFYMTPTPAMTPTLRTREQFAATQAPSIGDEAGPGDVVVFEFPQASAREWLSFEPADERDCVADETLEASPPPIHVKRIVATGGQSVALRSNQLVVDGEPISREIVDKKPTGDYLHPHRYIAEERLAETSYRIRYEFKGRDFEAVDVPEDHVFVLGDNRDYSSDSRCWGPLPREQILGRATRITWSADREGVNWDRLGRDL